MDKDIDIKLYNEYLNGKKDAFEILYNRYKDKIQYFIFNIVKDYQKAEDITQEVFIYILKNQPREDCSFKYYIYLVAKSRAYNYINIEKKRTEINEKYILPSEDEIEEDINNIVIRKETQKEILEAIHKLPEKYRNAIYLTKIEELSCQETAKILRRNRK